MIVLAVASYVFYVRYEFTKDHKNIRAAFDGVVIDGFVFDFCYENTCHYKYRSGRCSREFSFTLTSQLSHTLKLLNHMDDSSICRLQDGYIYLNDLEETL